MHVTHTTARSSLSTSSFSRFSSFTSLQRAIANLIVIKKKFKLRTDKLHEVKRKRKPAVESEHRGPSLLELQQATTVIIKAVQREVYTDEFKLQHQISTAEGSHVVRTNELKHMIKRSTLYHLNPFIDDDGILRVGGRLRRSKLEYREKHSMLMPKKHPVTTLIVRHYHLQVHHQGRLMTHGAIRQAGYWLVNGNQVVSNELNSCVVARDCADGLSNNKWLTFQVTEWKRRHPSPRLVSTNSALGPFSLGRQEEQQPLASTGVSFSPVLTAELSISKFSNLWTQAPLFIYYLLPETFLRSPWTCITAEV